MKNTCWIDIKAIETKEDRIRKELALVKLNEIINLWMDKINENMGITTKTNMT